MAEVYTVEQGECLWSIGRDRGISWKKLWDDPKNRPLRDRRENPNVLYPGDKVYIPDVQPKEVQCPTDRKHRFRVPGRLQVRIVLLDHGHRPISGVKYQYIINREAGREKKTGIDGMASENLPDDATSVVLRVPWGDFPVRLGHLDPTRTVRGLQQRLTNLGIDPGGIDGIMGPKTRQAIAQFQQAEAHAGLEPTGEPDEKTIRRLREVHDQQTLGGNHNQLEHQTLAAPELVDEEDFADPALVEDDYSEHGPQPYGGEPDTEMA